LSEVAYVARRKRAAVFQDDSCDPQVILGKPPMRFAKSFVAGNRLLREREDLKTGKETNSVRKR
jgi:hypothetical protein